MRDAICSKCGAPLSQDSSICASCETRDKTSQPPQPPRGRLSKRAIIGIIAAAAIVVTGVILLIIFLGGGDPSIQAAELCGDWSGSYNFENINATDLPGMYDPNVLKLVGQVRDIMFYVDLDENGKTIVGGDKFDNTDATYKSGWLTIKQGRGLVYSFEGGIRRKGDSYVIKGTWKLTDSDEEFASGSWTAEMVD